MLIDLPEVIVVRYSNVVGEKGVPGYLVLGEVLLRMAKSQDNKYNGDCFDHLFFLNMKL